MLNRSKTMTKNIKILGLLLLTTILLISYNNISSSNQENTPENGDLNNTFVDQRPTIELTPEQKYEQEKDRLISEGFDFEYFTSLIVYKNGAEYRFLYDIGYKLLDDDWILLVRKE